MMSAMRKRDGLFQLSATDLVGHVYCHHLTELERAVTEDRLSRPVYHDPLLDLLSARGAAHEQNCIDRLSSAGLDLVRIDGFGVDDAVVAETRLAMHRGVPVIVQAALAHDGWTGRADILRRVEVPSSLGAWSYEPVDAKLARETRAGTILQLCMYCDLLGDAQGLVPQYMHVVVPWSDFEPQRYRFADYAAYYRKCKAALAAAIAAPVPVATYPEPVAHCDICRWSAVCNQRRRADDHLSLVAGISKLQINELTGRGISTVKALGAVPLPLTWKPARGATESYVRIREQARIVVEARESGSRKFELLPIEPGFGLARLPEPSAGDIFLDLEGDPFVGEHGLEYLFGYMYKGEAEGSAYQGIWSLNRADEKAAFERFVDFVMVRWAAFPQLHIYHYAPYEPSALKRVMGRYATREDEIDRMLRGGLFVDLYQIVRHAVRASVESYSIKRLEPFYEFDRATALVDANVALVALQSALELDDIASISEETKAAVQAYNRDDCQSAMLLRDWLEQARSELISEGQDIPRPQPGNAAPSENVSDRMLRVNALSAQLTAGIPPDPAQRSEEQQARWLLANILDWHRREDKAVWWEYFRLADLSADELLDERPGLSGLAFIERTGGTDRAPTHRYRFPPQEAEIRGGEDLRSAGGTPFGKVEAISLPDGTVDIKKRQDTADIHPAAVFAHTHVRSDVMADALLRLGDHVAANGMLTDGTYEAARDLLLRRAPRVMGQSLQEAGESTVESAVRLSRHLAGGVLPIQGPPGAGKTFTGARMICDLVRRQKKVGVTANSHKVIRNLLDEILKAADELGTTVQCCQKADEPDPGQPRIIFATSNDDALAALAGNASVLGATAWLWSAPSAYQTVDVLFVDEAAQMALANVLAVSQAAKTVVLIGDPQQLNQPLKGSHPDGTDASALDHILAGQATIPPDKGLFLGETWRLHPDICAFTSELFYDDKLHAKAGLERQIIRAGAQPHGAGLFSMPVAHRGNQNSSPEEAEAVASLVLSLTAGNSTWVDRHGRENILGLKDIVIITPYNAQVFEIAQRLPGARVGTVDKFQGQEAPVAVYSTATSTYADAPRGLEFLYSLNRLNVATSRARCASIVVGSPDLLEAECRSPRQIQLVNAMCRFSELARQLSYRS